MEQALLVDLLLLRGRMLGRIADYERAAELAERLVRDASDDGTAWLARARAGVRSSASPQAACRAVFRADSSSEAALFS